MPIWNTPGVDEEPEITLKPWLVVECNDGQRFLIGFNVGAFEGRASTAIVETDLATMSVRTRSGRLYHLEGPPGLDPDAWHTWVEYAAREGFDLGKDVSADFWPGYDPNQCPVVDSRLDALGEALRSRAQEERSIEGLTPMEALRALTDEDSSDPEGTLQ